MVPLFPVTRRAALSTLRLVFTGSAATVTVNVVSVVALFAWVEISIAAKGFRGDIVKNRDTAHFCLKAVFNNPCDRVRVDFLVERNRTVLEVADRHMIDFPARRHELRNRDRRRVQIIDGEHIHALVAQQQRKIVEHRPAALSGLCVGCRRPTASPPTGPAN